MRFKVESASAHRFLPDLLSFSQLYTPRAQEIGRGLCRVESLSPCLINGRELSTDGPAQKCTQPK